MIYFYKLASTFNITILINLALKRPAPKRPAPKSHVPQRLYIYPPKFSTTFFSHLHKISIIQRRRQRRVLGVKPPLGLRRIFLDILKEIGYSVKNVKNE